jgi:peptide chain release factor subunit 1
MVNRIYHRGRLIENYKKFGSRLTFISDKSQEGFQFAKGFGGCGGFLRYSSAFLDEGSSASKGDGGDFDLEKDFI